MSVIWLQQGSQQSPCGVLELDGPAELFFPGAKGPDLCTFQGLVTAFGLSWGREQLWVPFEAIPGGGI